MNSKTKGFLMRLLIYILGLLILALGVAFSINSNLGVSPVSSLPYVISQISGIEMGKCVVIIYSLFVIVQILILRKEFKWFNLAQILFATIFGYFVTFAQYILGDFYIPTYAGQLTMLGISIILVAIGVSLYISANMLKMPMEGMVAAVNQKILKKLSFADVKVVMDTTVVTIGIVLSLIFFRKLVGIREGTIICALLVGKIMKPIQKAIGPKIKKL